MKRYSSSATLLSVRSGAAVLSWALLISAMLPVPSYALPVGPVIDNVLSITKLNQPAERVVSDDAEKIGPSAGNSRAASTTNPSSNNFVPPPENAVADRTTMVVTEPIKELSLIDPYAVQENDIRSSRLATSAIPPTVTNPAVVETSSMLQASNHGWKLFNVPWYWWLILPTAGYYLARQFTYWNLRRKSNNVIVS